MSTTIPREFKGTPKLTPNRVAILKDWYVMSLGDADKASDLGDVAYYQGLTDAFQDTLSLLHGKMETAAPVVKKSGHLLTNKNIIIGVSIYVVYKNRNKILGAIGYGKSVAQEFGTGGTSGVTTKLNADLDMVIDTKLYPKKAPQDD